MEILKELLDESKLPIIATSAYLKSIKGVVEYGYFHENGIVLPYVIRKKYCFKWMQLDNCVIGDCSNEKERIFLDNVVDYVRKKMKITHMMTTNTAIFNIYPTSSIFCKFGTYLVDLTQSEEILFSNLHSKHRNVIKKAEKDGIIIEHGKENAMDAIKLMKDTFNRQNKVSDFSTSMIERFNQLNNNVDYWIAKDSQGVLQGSAIFLWSAGRSCYYMHGGSASHTKPGAMNLLMWEAMKCMKDRGVWYFDFVGARVTTEEGSKLEGIQRFKSRFGAQMKVGYMFKVVINKPYYYLYKLAFNTAFLIFTKKIPRDIILEEREKGNL